MPFTLIIREEALEEMRETFLYYEGVQAGLGERFLSEVQKIYNKSGNTLNSTDLLTSIKEYGM
ncbi:MAG: hypothetical protein ABI288_02915 [Ginsengibacter sp.]